MVEVLLYIHIDIDIGVKHTYDLIIIHLRVISCLNANIQTAIKRKKEKKKKKKLIEQDNKKIKTVVFSGKPPLQTAKTTLKEC